MVPAEPPPSAPRSPTRKRRIPRLHHHKERSMRGILAWAIGIPIPIIILLYLTDVL
jgi:hypothetical protein